MESLKEKVFSKYFLSDSTPTYSKIADDLKITRIQVKEAIDSFRNNPDNRGLLHDIKRLKGLFGSTLKI